jgi:hypothetical protein
MNRIIKIIRGYSTKDALDALYYVARFIKQADSISKHDKDFFEDDYRSVPSEEARALSMKLIEVIEAKEGKPAAHFDNAKAIKILRELTSAEEALELTFTSAEEEGAREAIKTMTIPSLVKER